MPQPKETREKIELIQVPYSPFCIVQRRILEYAGVAFKAVDIPNGDRSLVWRLSKKRYYQVPLLKRGATAVFETDEQSQVIAKYLDDQFHLGLFPPHWEGVQEILWRYIENEVEGLGFKLNDIYAAELVPPSDWLRYLRHKERKFGRGCLEQWRQQQDSLWRGLLQRLMPFEQMVATRAFLLDGAPRFVDFDLYGIIGNVMFTGHYRFPENLSQLHRWHTRMATVSFDRHSSEKLHS